MGDRWRREKDNGRHLITIQRSLLQRALVHQRLISRDPLGIRVTRRGKQVNPMAKILQTGTFQHQPIVTILQTVERLSSEFESVICIIRQCLKMSQTLHNRFLNAGLPERCRNLPVGFFLQRLLFFHATKSNLQFTNADVLTATQVANVANWTCISFRD